MLSIGLAILLLGVLVAWYFHINYKNDIIADRDDIIHKRTAEKELLQVRYDTLDRQATLQIREISALEQKLKNDRIATSLSNTSSECAKSDIKTPSILDKFSDSKKRPTQKASKPRTSLHHNNDSYMDQELLDEDFIPVMEVTEEVEQAVEDFNYSNQNVLSQNSFNDPMSNLLNNSWNNSAPSYEEPVKESSSLVDAGIYGVHTGSSYVAPEPEPTRYEAPSYVSPPYEAPSRSYESPSYSSNNDSYSSSSSSSSDSYSSSSSSDSCSSSSSDSGGGGSCD